MTDESLFAHPELWSWMEANLEPWVAAYITKTLVFRASKGRIGEGIKELSKQQPKFMKFLVTAMVGHQRVMLDGSSIIPGSVDRLIKSCEQDIILEDVVERFSLGFEVKTWFNIRATTSMQNSLSS